jgi:ribosomal protein L37E
MSSVMDTIICAQCGFGEADLIFELDTTSYHVFCSVCGYVYKYFPEYEVIDDKRVFITDNEGRWIYTEKEYRGFGVLYIKAIHGVSEMFYFHKPITQKDVDYFNKILRDEEGIDPANSFLREWNNDKSITRAGSNTATR